MLPCLVREAWANATAPRYMESLPLRPKVAALIEMPSTDPRLFLPFT